MLIEKQQTASGKVARVYFLEDLEIYILIVEDQDGTVIHNATRSSRSREDIDHKIKAYNRIR